METIILFSSSYLIGSIPFGLILTKLFLKKDVRKVGSGNIGATNVLRTGDKFLALLTLIFDVGKGYLVIKYALIYYPEGIFLMGLICFLGHIFPVWLKFKGGKGVATYVGILFAINILLGFIFCVSWLLIFLISKYSSLSSLIGSLTIPVYIFFNDHINNAFFFCNYVCIDILYSQRKY